MEINGKKFSCHLFIFSHVLDHDFVIFTYFAHIAASGTVNDDVTKWITHRIFNTNFWCFFSVHILRKLLASLASFNTIYWLFGRGVLFRGDPVTGVELTKHHVDMLWGILVYTNCSINYGYTEKSLRQSYSHFDAFRLVTFRSQQFSGTKFFLQSTAWYPFYSVLL